MDTLFNLHTKFCYYYKLLLLYIYEHQLRDFMCELEYRETFNYFISVIVTKSEFSLPLCFVFNSDIVCIK
jgi:hypothetical protein